jgi:hypothetical protein
VTIDRLSEAQKRALVALRQHEPIQAGQYGVRTNTLFSLERLGLVEVRWWAGGDGRLSFYEGRLTATAIGIADLIA